MAVRVEELPVVDQIFRIVDYQVRRKIGSVESGSDRTPRNLFGFLSPTGADLYYWAKIGDISETGHLVGDSLIKGDRSDIQSIVEQVIGEYADLSSPRIKLDRTYQVGRNGRERVLIEAFPTATAAQNLGFSRKIVLYGETLACAAEPVEVLWRVVRL